MSRSFLVAALVYVVCPLFSPAAAGDVFGGLQPERIGSELASVLQGAGLACRQDPNDARIRLCHPLPGALDSLGGVPISSVTATFGGDQRLAQVTIYFAEERFSTIKAVLSARLGEGEDASFTVRAGMAGTFVNQVILWETDAFVAIARQYDGKIDRSSLIYGSPSALSRLLKRIKSKLPGGGDL